MSSAKSKPKFFCLSKIYVQKCFYGLFKGLFAYILYLRGINGGNFPF